MERVILHCDMNNFYASVECMLNMKLRGHPVAVGGDVENRHGIILAKNYEAKKYGVQTGEALWQAKEKCKDLIIVPPHYEQYLKYSKLAYEIYEEYTDLIEPYGMDECWLDITGSVGLFGDGEEVANIIKERIKFELGLTISVGVSFNKIFAKLGSDMKKPDAITVIPKDNFQNIIWDLPASDMLGVGRSTSKVLSMLGIHTIGQLANAPEQIIKSRLGKCGLMCVMYARGMDSSRVNQKEYNPPVKSVGHGITTKQDLENPAEVWNIMLALTQDIGHELRLYHKKAAGVQICIRNNQLSFRQWQCQMKTRTNSSAIIAATSFELFQKSYVWSFPIRSVTVRAINLYDDNEPEQLDLFGDITNVEKKEKIESVVESIRERFGKNSIGPATICKNHPKFPTDREIEIKMPTGLLC